MRWLPRIATGVVAALMATGAMAQDAAAPPEEVAAGAEEGRRQAITQFDDDGDGQLAGDELGRARAFLQALRREVGDRARGDGPTLADDARPLRDRGPEAQRDGRRRSAQGDVGRRDPGPEGRRRGPRRGRPPRPEGAPDGRRREGAPPEGLGGPPEIGLRGPQAPGPGPRPQDPAWLFERHDADASGELNFDEFAALMSELRDRRGPGPMDPPRQGRPPRDGDYGGGPQGDDPGGPPPGDGPALGGPDGPREVDGRGPEDGPRDQGRRDRGRQRRRGPRETPEAGAGGEAPPFQPAGEGGPDGA